MTTHAKNLSILRRYVIDNLIKIDSHAIIVLTIDETFGNYHSYQLCENGKHYLSYYKWDRILDSNKHISKLSEIGFVPGNFLPSITHETYSNDYLEEIILQAHKITTSSALVNKNWILDGNTYTLRVGNPFFPNMQINWRGDIPEMFIGWTKIINRITGVINDN